MGMMDYVRLSKSKGFSFDGRSQRAEFWWAQLYYSLLSTGLSIAMTFGFGIYAVGRRIAENGGVAVPESPSILTSILFGALTIAWLIFITYRTLPVTIRRLHDVGIPGWVYLIAWLLGLSGIFMLVIGCIDGERGQNKYGWNPKERSGGSYNRPHGIDPSFYN